jgi:hypothetical protein
MISYVKKTAENLFIGVPIGGVLGGSLYTVGTILGIAASAFSAFSLGNIKYFNRMANNLTKHEEKILANLYYTVIRVINPNFTSNSIGESGMISEKISTPIFKAAKTASKSNNWLIKHVVSRAEYASATCVSLITRTTDIAIGVLAAAVSIIPCAGRNPKINCFAIKQLRLLVVHDFCKGIRGTINPQQFN